jgi:molybdopterin-guanine dinucleotide biosynthesis protein
MNPPADPPAGTETLRRRTSRISVDVLSDARLDRAKEGFATRRVPRAVMRTLITGAVRPRAGDLVLARVDKIGQHGRIELPSGRKARLEPGSELILACGSRYASDQFEGLLPTQLGRTNLIAAGGIAATEAGRARGIKRATEITLLGLLGNHSGAPLNVSAFAFPPPVVSQQRPPVLAVFGTAMNSGKTTTAKAIVRGLTAAGFRTGYAKITGTGSGGDFWALADAGASLVVDFTDAGLAATYTTPISVLERTSLHLIGHLVQEGCQRIVIEVADGLLQDETAALMHSKVIQTLVDCTLFAAGDSLAAAAGVQMLRDAGFSVVGVSGLVSCSPLPKREVEKAGTPVLTKEELSDPVIASGVLGLHRTDKADILALDSLELLSPFDRALAALLAKQAPSNGHRPAPPSNGHRSSEK